MLIVEWFLKWKNNLIWPAWNMDYKYRMTDMYFRWKIKCVLGTLRIMGETAPLFTRDHFLTADNSRILNNEV